jgi:hypothetical protein
MDGFFGSQSGSEQKVVEEANPFASAGGSPSVDDLFGDPAPSPASAAAQGGDVLIDMDGAGSISAAATDDLAFQDFATTHEPTVGAASSSSSRPSTSAAAGTGGGGFSLFSGALGGGGEVPDAESNPFLPGGGKSGAGQSQQQQRQQQQQQSQQQPQYPPAVYSLAYYTPWFDVDTNQIFQRLARALLPLRPLLSEETGPRPDLYGPFWVTTTLIFTIAVTTNIANYLEFVPTKEHPEWNYDFNKVLLASTIIYSYVSLVPLGLWIFFKFAGAAVGLFDLICVYGYSMLIFNATAIVSMVPNGALRWLMATIGWAVSSAVLGVNCLRFLHDMPIKAKPGALAAVVLNLGLAVALKFLFFSYCSV